LEIDEIYFEPVEIGYRIKLYLDTLTPSANADFQGGRANIKDT
jgi:hypothetical protein